MVRVVLLFVLVGLALASEGAKWKYGKTDETAYGPNDWGKVSENCDKSAQSPINIETSSSIKAWNRQGLKLTCDNFGYVSGTIINNGHAPTLNINKALGTCRLTGGPLGNSKYKLQQLHFHFGCKDYKGSEHTVNGYAYSGELHLVTYNTNYPDFATAADKSDGLSVIGAFLEEDDDDDDDSSKALRKLAETMTNIREEGQQIRVYGLSLYGLVPQLKYLSGTSFYSYKGSLTTPPCYQSVNWIVLSEAISARKRELDFMRRLLNHEKRSMCDNFRPTQPINGRIVSEYSG